MEIIKATNYGFRTVLLVLMNPGEPEWIHRVGSPLRDDVGAIVHDDAGKVAVVPPPPADHVFDGTVCHNCRYNWVVRELIFDGAEFADKSADELWELVCVACRPAPSPEEVVGLVGRSD